MKKKSKNSLFLGLLLSGSLTSTATAFDEIKMSRWLYNTFNFYVKGQRFILIEDYFNLSNVGNNIHEKGLAVAHKLIQKQICEIKSNNILWSRNKLYHMQ